MDEDPSTPGRGTAESAKWFRDKLDELQLGHAALARLMLANGDDRQLATILRTLGRMASGEARVSGEMRALLGLLSGLSNAVRGLRPAPRGDAAPAEAAPRRSTAGAK